MTAALTALSFAGPKMSAQSEKAAVLALARDLESNTYRRTDALNQLRELGRNAAPAIPSLLCLVEMNVEATAVPHGGNLDLREATETLSTIGPQIIPPILEVFSAPCSSPVGKTVAGRPCRLRLRDETMRPEYCGMVRSWLAGALAGLDSSVVPDLLAAYRSSSSRHRPWLARAIGSFGEPASPGMPRAPSDIEHNWSSAVQLFMTDLRADDPELRVACADALGSIGPPAREAAPVLRLLAAGDDRQLRVAAQLALKKIIR
jgi:HEAT repeat protein